MSENASYNQIKEIAQMQTLVEMQGKQIQSVVCQMQESTKAITELTGELRNTTKSHETLSKDFKEQIQTIFKVISEKEKATDSKIIAVSDRVTTLEKEEYAAKGWKDTLTYIRRAVLTAIVLALLGLIGFNLNK